MDWSIGHELFFEKERNYISNLQKSKENLFYFNNLWLWHKSIFRKVQNKEDSIDKTFKWLDLWNFNEPDSLFIIYADHGFNVVEKTKPDDYLTWIFIKDNTIKPLEINRKIISSCDIYKTILDKIGWNDYYSFIESSSIEDTLDKDKIFYIEDSRAHISETKCFTATGVKIIEWYENNYPKKLLQVTYNKNNSKFHYFTLDFEESDYNPYSFTELNNEDIDKFKTHIDDIKINIPKKFKWLEN